MGAESLMGAAAGATPWGAIAGIGSGLLSSGIGLITGGRQKKLAKQAAKRADALNAQSMQYANDVLSQAKSGQAEARNLYNARMANAGAIEKDIYQNQANTLGTLGRNATDSSQMLALAGGVQGNSNQAFNQLAQTEAEDKQRRYYNVMGADQNVQGALGNMANLYGNQAAQAQQSANQLMASGAQNQMQGLDTLMNTGIMAGMGSFGTRRSTMSGGSVGAPVTKSVNIQPRIGIGSVSGIPSSLPPLNGVNLSLPYPSIQPKPFTSPLQYTNPFFQ